MSKVPLPERGQPLDVNYIYQLANAVNDVSSQISPSSAKYVTVETPGQGARSAKTSDTRILAVEKIVVTNSSKNIGDEEPFEYAFPAEFKFKPVAVATPVNIGQTNAGENVSVVLKSVGTSRVEGLVRFNETGNLSVSVNILIIGIPL
jgi:hypothetical protein